MTIQYVQTAILIGAGKPAAPSFNLIIGMAIKIVLNYFLIVIPAINIKGAIIGNAVGWFVAIVLNQIAIKKRFSFKIHFVRKLIYPIFASTIMGVGSLLFYQGADWLFQKVLSHPVIGKRHLGFSGSLIWSGNLLCNYGYNPRSN